MSKYLGESIQNNIEQAELPLNSLMELEKIFNERYKFIYDNDDKVPGYREAVNIFDSLLDDDNLHALIKEFCGYRQDFISSDREAAAFVMALRDMKYID